MSKLAIVLSAALFASAGNAFSWNETLESMQKSMEEVTNSVITKLEEEFEDTQLKAVTAAVELGNKTTEFGWEVTDELSSIAAKFADEINELVHLAQGVDIKECLELSDRLAVLSSAVTTKTETCIDNKVDTGLGYIETIREAASEALEQLDEVKEQAQHCGDNVNDAKSTFEAIFCYKGKGAKATWISMKAAPTVTVGWSKLKFLMVTLRPALNSCTKYERAALFLESSVILQRTKECIQKKIDEAPITTETYQPTETEQTTQVIHTTDNDIDA